MELFLGTIFIVAVIAAKVNRRFFEEIIGLAFLWRILRSFRNPVHFTRKRFPQNVPTDIILGHNEVLLVCEKAKAQIFKMEKKDEYSQLFHGNLFLTNERIVFIHSEGTVIIPRKKIISLSKVKKGIKVYYEGKNPVFFTGKNLTFADKYDSLTNFSVDDFIV